MEPIELLPPHMRNHPDAAEFAERLSEELGELADVFEDVKGYAWEAEIPPRAEWDRHAKELAAHTAKELAELDFPDPGDE